MEDGRLDGKVDQFIRFKMAHC